MGSLPSAWTTVAAGSSLRRGPGIRAGFDDGDLVRGVEEQGGERDTDPSAADDEHLSDMVRLLLLREQRGEPSRGTPP
jgi:hypothetical protein